MSADTLAPSLWDNGASEPKPWAVCTAMPEDWRGGGDLRPLPSAPLP